MPSFGQTIVTARRKAGLSQKDLAGRIVKEDGTSISPQYLNDLERDRRNPPSEELLRQFAVVLSLEMDYLSFLAGQLPADIRQGSFQPEDVQAAFQAFRRRLNQE